MGACVPCSSPYCCAWHVPLQNRPCCHQLKCPARYQAYLASVAEHSSGVFTNAEAIMERHGTVQRVWDDAVNKRQQTEAELWEIKERQRQAALQSTEERQALEARLAALSFSCQMAARSAHAAEAGVLAARVAKDVAIRDAWKVGWAWWWPGHGEGHGGERRGIVGTTWRRDPPPSQPHITPCFPRPRSRPKLLCGPCILGCAPAASWGTALGSRPWTPSSRQWPSSSATCGRRWVLATGLHECSCSSGVKAGDRRSFA